MVPVTTDTASDWLTELDVIDTSWKATAFRYSHLGRLPLELLEIIFEHIPRSHLPAVARITPQLRELAEKGLYVHLDLHNATKGWEAPEEQLWRLHCTLYRRPDLAQMVRTFSSAVYDQDIKIEISTTSVFDGDEHFRATAKLSLSQIAIGGRILMEQLPNVEKVAVSLRLARIEAESWTETERCKHLARKPLSAGRLIPNFDTTTAHSLHFPGLQQLTTLRFAGSEFHWALAKLPRLRKLQLRRPCVFLPDNAPNELNAKLKILDICAGSDILRSSSMRYINLKSFLAHFTSVEGMTLTIYDLEVDSLSETWSDPPDEAERSYHTLLERLSPVADQLTYLHLSMYDAGDNHSNSASKFLNDVQPAYSFQNFKKLTSLTLPYQSLLGKVTSTVETVPSPATLLPATLQFLKISCPHIFILDWLTLLRTIHDRLPDLYEIELNCQLPYGGEWPVFAFENIDHPVFDMILSELDIDLYVTKRERDWKEEWEEYDSDVVDVIDWLDSLAEHGGMDRLLEWINSD